MSCNNCDIHQEGGLVAYYRWGIANVGIMGCPEHVKEIIDVLNADQRARRGP